MSTLTHFGSLSLHRLRLAWHVPAHASRSAPAWPATHGHWLERLAAWSDRQPPRQHRLGSYTALT